MKKSTQFKNVSRNTALFLFISLTVLSFQNMNVNTACEIRPIDVSTTTSSNSSACFGPNSNILLKKVNKEGFQLIQLAPPPWSTPNINSSQYFPATHFATLQIERVQSMPPKPEMGTQSYNLWANRCARLTAFDPSGNVLSKFSTPPDSLVGAGSTLSCANTTVTKGNVYARMIPVINDKNEVICSPNGEPKILRPIFSSLAKANLCTEMQAMQVIYGGQPSKYMNLLAAQGKLTLFVQPTGDNQLVQATSLKCGEQSPLQNQKLSSLATTAQIGSKKDSYLIDVCILPPMGQAQNASVTGITLDYEVQDNRTTNQTKTLFLKLKRILGDKKLTVYTNDLSTAGVKNGLIPKTPQETPFAFLLGYVDFLAPILWTGATPGGPVGSELNVQSYKFTLKQDFDKQIALMKGDRAQLPLHLRRKIMFMISLYYDDCNRSGNMCANQLEDLALVRRLSLEQGHSGFIIFRNGVNQIGAKSCSSTSTVDTGSSSFEQNTNQIMACIAYGRCKKESSISCPI